jgi:glycosyltransferase involved in cell wall biosynthesis
VSRPDGYGDEAPELSAILPCHEEAANLEGVVAALESGAQQCGVRFLEVLLVCSRAARDGTPEVARALAVDDARLRVLQQGPTPAGYGGALKLGLQHARAPWVLILDADGQLDPSELPLLWHRRGPRTAVLGVRSSRSDSWPRRLAGNAYRRSARWALGRLPRVADPDCAFKLFPREAVDSERLRSTSGAVNLELLASLHARGVAWAEVPVTHHPRRAGKGRFEVALGPLHGLPRPGAALELLHDVVALRLRRLVGS